MRKWAYFQVKKNPANHLIRRQGNDIQKLVENKHLTKLEHFQFNKALEKFFNFQGKYGQIKNTHTPQYGSFSEVFVWIFALLMPFGLVGEFDKAV